MITKFKIYDNISENHYIVEVIDHEGKTIELKSLKRYSNLDWDIARQISFASQVKNQSHLSSFDQCFVYHDTILCLEEYFPLTYKNLLIELHHLSYHETAKQKRGKKKNYSDSDSDSESESGEEIEGSIPIIEFKNGSVLTLTYNNNEILGKIIIECSNFELQENENNAKTEQEIKIFYKLNKSLLHNCLTKKYRFRNTVTGFSGNNFPKFFQDIASELIECGNQLASCGFFHSNLKPENIGLQIDEENCIKLLFTGWDHSQRLNHNFDLVQIPFVPVAPSEMFFRQPVVQQSIDVWAVGLLLGDLLAPSKSFFPDPNDSDNEEEENSNEDGDGDDKMDINDDDDDDDDDEEEEEEVDEESKSLAWGGMSQQHVDWFMSMLEARGLMQWLDKDNKNYDDFRQDTGIVPQKKNYDDEDDEEDEEEEDEDEEENKNLSTDCKIKGIALKDSEKLKITPLTEEEVAARFRYISLHPDNINHFILNLMDRRGNLNIQFIHNLPFWLIKFWIQMFIADPSLRPTFIDLKNQLENPETKKMRFPRPSKSKPLKTPEPTELVPYNPNSYFLQNPCHWNQSFWFKNYEGNPLKVLKEYSLSKNMKFSSTQIKNLIDGYLEIRNQLESKTGIFPETTIQVLDLFYRLKHSNNKEKVIACFLLIGKTINHENIKFSHENQAQFENTLQSTWVQLQGKINADDTLEQALFIALSQLQTELINAPIEKENIRNTQTEFEIPITFFELWQQVATFFTCCFLLGNTEFNFEQDLEQIGRISHQITCSYVSNNENKFNKESYNQDIINVIKNGFRQAKPVVWTIDDEDENERINEWILNLS